MINLLLVADGPRDEHSVPPLLETILGKKIRSEFKPWVRLNSSGGRRGKKGIKGYARKLRYHILQAHDERSQGLVAVIDKDKDSKGKRLKALKEGRNEERRESPPFPTAIGQAIPHGEAWLLDDPVAVREALQLPADASIPNVMKCSYPKDNLDTLKAESSRSSEKITVLLGDIARVVDPDRCQHKKQTGFGAFMKDVVQELGEL